MPFALPGVADPAAAAILFVAAFAGGLVRGFTGFGFAMVFVPAAAVVVGPATAASLIWLIDAPFALPLALRSFRRIDWREAAPLAIGAVAALPLGAFLLTWLDRALARWIIALSIALALAALMSGWRYRGRPGAALSLSVGGLSGLYNGFSQMGGMPLAIFWLGSQTGDARRTRDNMQGFFVLMTVATGIVFALAGILKAEHVWIALPLAVAYGLGVVIGVKSFGLASEEIFRRIAYAVIGASVVLALPVFDRWVR